jgi:hypothetical protein
MMWNTYVRISWTIPTKDLQLLLRFRIKENNVDPNHKK